MFDRGCPFDAGLGHFVPFITDGGVSVEMYQHLMKVPNMRQHAKDEQREIVVRIHETQAGMSSAPKYARTLATILRFDRTTHDVTYVRMVWTKYDTYVIHQYAYKCHETSKGEPLTLCDTDSRIEAITQFEQYMCDGFIWYVQGRTGVSIPF